MHKDGYKIVFITNQKGIPRGKPTVEDFKKKMDNIAKSIDIPLLVMASTDSSWYRKPGFGMWLELKNVDYSNSFYVGDAAGRTGDFSCSDRKFAINVGRYADCELMFRTPEEYFLGESINDDFCLGVDPLFFLDICN